MALHTANHRRGVAAAPHRAAAEAGRRDSRRRRQRARSDGRDGGDHRRRLSAHEPCRRRRLLAGARTVRPRARADGAGPAGARATVALYREHGHDTIPARGPLAALTVPGAIGGWMLALEAAKAFGGKLPLDVLLAAAISHAREGYVGDPQPGATDRRQAAGNGRRPPVSRERFLSTASRRRRARRSSSPPSRRRSISSATPGSRISIAAMSGARSPPTSTASAAR